MTILLRGQGFLAEAVAGKTELSSRPERSAVEGPAVFSRGDEPNPPPSQIDTPMPRDLPKAYDPAAIEDRWGPYWVEEKLFDQPHAEDPSTTPVFSVLLPPPNVTGR